MEYDDYYSRPIEAYFYYLSEIIGHEEMGYDYFDLLHGMHEITFFNVVDLDKNRISDAYNYTRKMWEDSGGERVDILMPSVLEVIVSLCLHVIDYLGEDNEYSLTVPMFFWTIIRNLGWDIYSDSWFNSSKDYEQRTERNKLMKTDIVAFVLRKYGHDGVGGPFPIMNGKNQNEMDLWTQAMHYLVTNYGVK